MVLLRKSLSRHVIQKEALPKRSVRKLMKSVNLVVVIHAEAPHLAQGVEISC